MEKQSKKAKEKARKYAAASVLARLVSNHDPKASVFVIHGYTTKTGLTKAVQVILGNTACAWHVAILLGWRHTDCGKVLVRGCGVPPALHLVESLVFALGQQGFLQQAKTLHAFCLEYV